MSDLRVMYTYTYKPWISLLSTGRKYGTLKNKIMVTCKDCSSEIIFDVSAALFTEWYDMDLCAADAFGWERNAAECIQRGMCSDCITQELDDERVLDV